MKSFKYLLIASVMALFFSACQKDEISMGETEIIDFPSKKITTLIYGLITDYEGTAIEGVHVSTEGGHSETQTDENGYFRIDNSEADANGAVVRFKKEGYFENYKLYLPDPENSSFLRIQMVTRNEIGTITPDLGGQLSTPTGASISFPLDAFVNGDGEPISSEVKVYGHWYDPNHPQLIESMPGDLRGSDADNERVQLGTYGMMAVELADSDGNEVYLAEGKEAILSFPLSGDLLASAPEVIPTWSLDETSGYWVEEGTAQLVEDAYVAAVPHFSFWNCDIPFRPIATLHGKVVDPDGRAISDALVCITMVTTSLSSYGYTKPDGTFSCIVPAETPIIISVKNTCGNIIKTVELVVEGENYDLGEIAVDLSINLVTITGNLICDGIPVTEGYAHLVLSNGTQYAANTDENGAFEIQLTGCGNNIKYTFRGYDHSNGNASIAEVITTTDTELDFSNTQVCTELPEFIIYKINDELRTITDPSARFLNGKLLFEGQLPLVESGFDASVENPTVGQHIPELLSAYIFDSSTSISVACDEATSCADFLIDITEIGTVGDLVRGTFSALNDSVSLTGSFKIIIDSDDTAGSISGNVWTDADGDGERADNEYYNGERFDINLLDNSGTLVRTTTAIWTMESFVYFFKNLEVGSYVVEPVLPGGFDLLDLNSTSDEARDNDIDPTTGRSETITIDLGNLEEAVDIGFVKNEELDCRVEILSFPNCWNEEQGQVIFYPLSSDSLSASLTVRGPSPLTDAPLNAAYNLTLLPGSYTWEIVTEDGRSCDGAFELTVMAELPCEFGYEATECLSGLVDFIIYFDCGPNVLINMGVEDLQWEWEDGSSEPYLLGVSPGMYQYTITADNDCTTTGVMDLHPYNGLSGSVWVENAFLNDGIKDPGEDYLYDYPVNLYRASDPSTIYMTDNTSADGIYSFTKLPIGDYLISVELEDGYEFTDYRVVGSTTSNDNDVNPVDGFSDSYSIIDGCEFYNQVDIGIREK